MLSLDGRYLTLEIEVAFTGAHHPPPAKQVDSGGATGTSREPRVFTTNQRLAVTMLPGGVAAWQLPRAKGEPEDRALLFFLAADLREAPQLPPPPAEKRRAPRAGDRHGE